MSVPQDRTENPDINEASNVTTVTKQAVAIVLKEKIEVQYVSTRDIFDVHPLLRG